MNINKFFILSLTIIVSIGYLLYAGPAADSVRSQRTQLTQQKTELSSLVQQLRGGYDQLNQQLVAQLRTASDTINSQLSSTKAIQSQISSIPKAVLSLVQIGDLPQVVTYIIETINGMKNTVDGVLGRFQTSVDALNYNTDPKGLYKKLNESITAMDAALVQIKEIEDFLTDLGA